MLHSLSNRIQNSIEKKKKVKVIKKIPTPKKNDIISNKDSLRGDDLFKDSLEGSYNISKTNILIPDSLNNTRNSLINSLISHQDDYTEEKTKECTKAKLKQNSKQNSSEKNNIIDYGEETKKISYKYITNYPLKNLHNQNENLYWYATYDKLLSKKNLLYILNYYQPLNNNYDNMKEKTLIINDFSLSIDENTTKPFIYYNKGDYIFVKLYLMSLKDINKIFNFLNKVEHTLNQENIEFNNVTGQKLCIRHNNKVYPYSDLLCLGTFLNICIYTFVLDFKNPIPKSKNYKIDKLVNLTKYLILLFPNYSIDFFIHYLTKNIKKNSNQISEEIKEILNKGNNNSQLKKVTFQRLDLNNLNLKLFSLNKTQTTNSIENIVCTPLEDNNIKKHSVYNSFNKNIINKNNLTNIEQINSSEKVKSLILQKKPENENIFVVQRKLKSDIDFDLDNDSSSVISKKGETEKIFVTPKKKKIKKYYS